MPVLKPKQKILKISKKQQAILGTTLRFIPRTAAINERHLLTACEVLKRLADFEAAVKSERRSKRIDSENVQ
jgi:hypothetical protein